MRRPFVFGPAHRLGTLSRFEFLSQRPQARAQLLEFLVLAIDHITEFSIGAFQEGQLELQSFYSVLVHGLGMIRQNEHDADAAALAVTQAQAPAVRLRDLAA